MPYNIIPPHKDPLFWKSNPANEVTIGVYGFHGNVVMSSTARAISWSIILCYHLSPFFSILAFPPRIHSNILVHTCNYLRLLVVHLQQ